VKGNCSSAKGNNSSGKGNKITIVRREVIININTTREEKQTTKRDKCKETHKARKLL
jgi:hypothetical protein